VQKICEYEERCCWPCATTTTTETAEKVKIVVKLCDNEEVMVKEDWMMIDEEPL
jgi:hypothetical protein